MKKLIILSAIALLGFASCKKSSDPKPDTVYDFETDYSEYFVSQPVVLKNNSTNASAYSWDFGDGRSSAGQTPSLSYNVPGNYSISLGGVKKAIVVHPESHSVLIDNKTIYDMDIVLFNRISDDKTGNERYNLGKVKAGTKSKLAFSNEIKIGVSGVLNGVNFVIMTPRQFEMKKGAVNVITIDAGTSIGYGLKLPEPSK